MMPQSTSNLVASKKLKTNYSFLGKPSMNNFMTFNENDRTLQHTESFASNTSLAAQHQNTSSHHP